MSVRCHTSDFQKAAEYNASRIQRAELVNLGIVSIR